MLDDLGALQVESHLAGLVGPADVDKLGDPPTEDTDILVDCYEGRESQAAATDAVVTVRLDDPGVHPLKRSRCEEEESGC